MIFRTLRLNYLRTKPAGTPVLALFCLALITCLSSTNCSTLLADDRPNILWLSTEDIGPHLGCYGDPDANTPSLDAFAKRSMVYDYAWSNYPVCAPARTTIIGGVYAAANGAGNMRSAVKIPSDMKLFPKYLREAGYYCTNNSKEDYNYLETKGTWDESSKKAHYKNREAGQPFFAVFNYTGTHESQLRKRPHEKKLDPATVHLAKYWPDTPEVRQDWAQYHDKINTMDKWFNKHLKELESAGLAENTIVVFFGDHGSGMPRHKRFAGNSGQQVPFIVHIPEKFKALAGEDYAPGQHLKRPVGFIDLAPTMLSIAGIEPKSFMQGHAFVGKYQATAPKYLYGFRDRMDERPDTSRAIRDERFIYVRNYNPHVPAGQYLDYQQQTPATKVWYRMFQEGKLNEVQSHFWENHPPEELYDLVNDPDETINLIDSEEHQKVVQRFREENRNSFLKFGDLGLIPEAILLDFGKATKSRREALSDNSRFPMAKIFKIANVAADPTPGNEQELITACSDRSDTVRYWGAYGLMVGGESACQENAQLLEKLCDDSSDAVAIVAGECLAKFGNDEQKMMALEKLASLSNFDNSNYFAAVQALNALSRIENLPQSIKNSLADIPTKSPLVRSGVYVGAMKGQLLGTKKKNKKNK